jgi:hypothetical protein
MIGMIIGGEVENVCAEGTEEPLSDSKSSDGGLKLIATGPKSVILAVEFSFGKGKALDGEAQIAIISATYEQDNSDSPTLLVQVDLPEGVSIFQRYGQHYFQYEGAQAALIKGRPLFPGSLTQSQNSSTTTGGTIGGWYNIGISGQSGESRSEMQGKEVPTWLGDQLVKQEIISEFSFVLNPNGSKSALVLNEFLNQRDVSFGAGPKDTIASSLTDASMAYTTFALGYLANQKRERKQEIHPAFEPSLEKTAELKEHAIYLIQLQLENERLMQAKQFEALKNMRLEMAQYN